MSDVIALPSYLYARLTRKSRRVRRILVTEKEYQWRH